MTPDEAREAFDDAFEGELDQATRAAFDAALATDADLRVEWDAFMQTMRLVRGVGLDVDQATEKATAEPLLREVQLKLRTRSRGRFYRDRFSTIRRQELVLPIALAVIACLLLAVAWAGHRVVDVSTMGEGGHGGGTPHE